MKSSAIFKVTDRYLKANPKKTWLSRISIILMVALMTCVFVGKDTVIRYMSDVAESLYGSWHYSFYNVNEEEYEQIQNFSYMKETALSENLQLSMFEQSANSNKPFLNIRYYSKQMFAWNNIELSSGRLPENEDEIVIAKSAIDEGSSIQPGDRIEADCFQRYIHNFGETTTVFPFQHVTIEPGDTVAVPDSFPYFDPDTEAGKEFLKTHEERHEPNGFSHTFTISGIIETPSFEAAASAAYTAITFLPEGAAPHADTFNGMCVIDADHAYNASWDFYELLGADRYKANNQVLAFSGNSSEGGLNSIILIAQIFFMILIAAVSVILIYNIFQLSYDERRTYLGMLSSIGATARQKRSSVYYEAFSHLLWALPLGFLLGLIIVYGGVSLLKPYTAALSGMEAASFESSMTVPLRLCIKPLSVILTMAFSILTVLVSSLIPARKVSKIGIIDSIRGNDPSFSAKRKKKSHSASASGMITSALNTYDSRRTNSIVRAVSGFLIILFVISYAASMILQMVEFKLIAGEETIERTSPLENVQLSETEQVYGFFVYRNADNIFEDVKKQIEQTEGVHGTDFYCEIFYAGLIDHDLYSEEYENAYRTLLSQFEPPLSQSEIDSYFENTGSLNIYAVSDDVYEEMLKKTNGTDSENSCILCNHTELSTKNYRVEGTTAPEYRFYEVARSLDLEKGQQFNFQTSVYNPEKDDVDLFDISFEVASVTDGTEIADDVKFHTEYPWIIIPERSLYGQPFAENASFTLTFIADTKDPQSADLIMRLEELSADENSGVYFTSRSGGAGNAMQIISGMIRIIMTCFAVIVSIISLLNIFNSVSALHAQRSKMNAALESIGMTRKQLKAVYARETAGMILKSIMISLPIILALSWLIRTLMMSRFGDFSVRVPYLLLCIVMLAAILSVFAIQQLSFRLSSKSSLIEQIRSEAR